MSASMVIRLLKMVMDSADIVHVEMDAGKRIRLLVLILLTLLLLSKKNKEHPNMDSLFAGYNGKYFEFEDPRDGRKYKYLKFEGRSEDFDAFTTFYVMAENLNYGKMIPSGTTKFDDSVTEKLCYVDDEWFCDNHFGGLYTWAEAMNLPKVCDSVAVDSNDACKAITEKRDSNPGEEYLNIMARNIRRLIALRREKNLRLKM